MAYPWLFTPLRLCLTFAEIPSSPNKTTARPASGQSADDPGSTSSGHLSWYLDRLGKLERFRRAVYSATLTPYSDDLWLGLMTVLEWGKDLDEPVGDDLPAFTRDVINFYLVTSRDGQSPSAVPT